VPIDGPSLHLSWDELACRDVYRTEYPSEWRATRAVELAKAFERVRELCGFPLLVNSGFRTHYYNLSIGGAAKSQHVQGRALDLVPVGMKKHTKKARLADLSNAAAQARREGLLRGIGIYSGFVHIDTRPGANASWSGPRTPIS
jgi:uncharacterized protein YcbK (DUF882 family)